MVSIEDIDFAKGSGLVPAVIQHIHTKEVLMLGFMNKEALQATLESGLVTFYSRSNKRLWQKGESSGHFLSLCSIDLDCDSDTLLVKAEPTGPTCHSGQASCFFKPLQLGKPAETSELPAGTNQTASDAASNQKFTLKELESIIKARRESGPDKSYTRSLFQAGQQRITQKVGEEATEVIVAALSQEKSALLEESADLLFHLLVLLVQHDASLSEVEEVLQSRHRCGQKD